jgi:hypothetical protein
MPTSSVKAIVKGMATAMQKATLRHSGSGFSKMTMMG